MLQNTAAGISATEDHTNYSRTDLNRKPRPSNPQHKGPPIISAQSSKVMSTVSQSVIPTAGRVSAHLGTDYIRPLDSGGSERVSSGVLLSSLPVILMPHSG